MFEINNEKIGCISAVAYNNAYGFIGLYIVVPKYRGQGFGMRLWNHAIHYLGIRCMGLDGVVAQQENYKKSHFQLYYKNIRYQGKGRNSTPSLINLKQIPFKKVLEFDTQIFGLSRNAFLESWLNMPNAFSLAKLEEGNLKGYGTIRKCTVGYKIGPLFAENLELADEIYINLCSKAGEDPVFLDVPESNPLAMTLINSLKLEKVFETARMYTLPPPKQQLHRVFGVTTFELG